MTSRTLAPGARADGIVVFERPTFKESRERLLLAVAQAEEVDRPVLAPIAFVAPAAGGGKGFIQNGTTTKGNPARFKNRRARKNPAHSQTPPPHQRPNRCRPHNS